MSNNKQSSIEWYTKKLYDIEIAYNLGVIETDIYIKSKSEALEQAKAMHKQEHSNTWDDSVDNYLERGKNVVRHWSDFDEYYNDKFK